MSERLDDEDRLTTAPENKRPAAIIAVVTVLLLCFAVSGIYFAFKPTSGRLIDQKEEEFRAGNDRAAPSPPARPPVTLPTQQQPAAQQNDRLAELLLRMEQQRLAEEAAAAAKARKEAEQRAKEAAEQRRARVSASVLVESSGGQTAPEPTREVDSADVFARTIAAATGQTAAPESRAYDFVPSAGSAAVPVVSATLVGPLPYRLNQGKIISAVLESRIVSDKPGVVRAMVDENIYSEDGSEVLIRPGARLIGEYRSALSRGDSRLLVIWNRLIRPDGASINLTSPGVDELGVSGLTGDVDSRFFDRFGASILLSIVDIAVEEQSSDAGVVVASSAESSASIALRDSINIPPRITIDQGQRIAVMVAKDLDFQRVGEAGP